MKISELLEWKRVAKSPDGRERRFKSHDEADTWAAGTHPKLQEPKQKQFKSVSAYLDWADREADKQRAANKPKASEIWNQFLTAVGNSFPDGDFIDHIGPWLNKHDLTFDDLNAAVREYDDAKDAYEYVARMWDDHAMDARHDAEQEGSESDRDWYNRPNPWK